MAPARSDTITYRCPVGLDIDVWWDELLTGRAPPTDDGDSGTTFAIVQQKQGELVAAVRIGSSISPIGPFVVGLIDEIYKRASERPSREILREVLNLARKVGWSWLYTTVGMGRERSLRLIGFEPRHFVISKTPNKSIPLDSLTAFQIRPADAADCSFAITGVQRAIWHGCTRVEQRFYGPGAIKRAAAWQIATVARQHGIVLLAEICQIRAGLSFVSFDGDMAFLHDTFIRREFKGRGIARALNEIVEAAAAERGCSRLFGTVNVESASVVIPQLQACGWLVDRLVCSRPVDFPP